MVKEKSVKELNVKELNVKVIKPPNKLTFEEKELDILRDAVDEAEHKLNKKIKQSSDIINIIKILETFLRRKKMICYGGTAINNILPKSSQFYDKSVDIPDYDVYSSIAIDHATELADNYASHGYSDVEVRSGMHVGTYKVFVNFIPVADITHMEPKLFKVLYEKSVRIEGISYAPPDYLRLSMYNELSRPDGDVSRWEKVYKRLVLLNKHYPFNEHAKCSEINFMRDFTGNPELNNTLYTLVKDTIINEGAVFLGGYASSLYGRYMPPDQKKQLQEVPDFDVLAEDAKATAYIIKEKLENAGFKNVKLLKKPSVGDDIIFTHYEIVVDEDTLCFIYEPSGCFSYNTIKISNKTVKVATIETMLLFSLSFIYSDRPYYDHERIMCMAQYLINVQAANRLEQKGLLKRFNINCYGNEKTIMEIRSQKAEKYEQLKNAKDTKEYNRYFYKYNPATSAATGTSTTTSTYKHKHNIHKNKRTRKNKYNKNNKINKKYNKNNHSGVFGNIW